MKNKKDFINFISRPSQINLERSKKLFENTKDTELKKANPPQWFDFLSEEARELLIPSIFIQKSSHSN